MHPKGTFCPAGAVLRSISAGPEDAADMVCQSILLPKSNGFESRIKVETLPKSKGHPLPKSRMILREKISGKVELGLYYALLFHDSGIYPVFSPIPHVVLLQVRVFQPKSDRVQGFVADKVERVRSRIGLKVGWFSPIMYFCCIVLVYSLCFWPFHMEICFKKWFWMWGNYSCLGVFFDDDGKSFTLFPALFSSFGLYSPLLSRFFGVYCCL